jgi:GMP synthase-like glutamine amidotransferase
MPFSSLDHVLPLISSHGLIPGHSAYDDVEWINNLCAFVKRIYEEHPSKKIIGICFGHQIVARALGGKVEVNGKGWEMAVRQVNLVESARKVFDLKEPVMVN